jgi:hypothetical protein
LGVPVLVNDGVVRIALTGFDKSLHDELLPELLNRLDEIMSLEAHTPVVRTFLEANPFYASASAVTEDD